MVWHLDVGLSFPKSVGSLIGGSAGLVVSLNSLGRQVDISWFKRQSLTFMILKYRFNSFRDAHLAIGCILCNDIESILPSNRSFMCHMHGIYHLCYGSKPS